MARRSSARLRNRNSTTPKRVSLSHDAPVRTPRTVLAKLSALQENDEMPGAFPQSASPPARHSPTYVKRRAIGPDATPKDTTPIRPSDAEMHPQQHQQTTAKPLDEARHLGFSNMGAYTEPPKPSSRIATLQGTPTRARNPTEDTNSPTYAFTFRREHSLELSPEAKKLMNEKREEAARIREQMAASAEKPTNPLDAAMREIATPKSKKGRFSGVHMAQFEKMDSIAGHASAFRAKPSTAEEGKAQSASTQSLKRSPSKAQLDDQGLPSQKTLHRSPSKPNLPGAPSQLPRPTSTNDMTSRGNNESPPPAKRVKRTDTQDVYVSRPNSSHDEKPLQATPEHNKGLRMHPNNPHLSTLATPTQSSLARAASTKSTQTSRIPGPLLVRSPSKPALVETEPDNQGRSVPLLSRSPSKVSLFTHVQSQAEQTAHPTSPLLARSPLKASPLKSRMEPSEDRVQGISGAPLLSRNPVKMSVTKNAESEAESEKPSAIPLLARSPAKMALSETSKDQAPQTPGKASGSGLMGRFNLLRSSPMKSILRTPQRLYSDDPAKVAAGTHLATPPKHPGGGSHTGVPSTAPLQKRVDFSSSTKARDQVARSDESSTPSKNSTPPTTQNTVDKSSSEPIAIDYPALPNDAVPVSPSPQKRRQTIAPGDFTFRAGNGGIVFSQSPKAHPNAVDVRRASTIRHVSADTLGLPVPAAGSKKRKFEFENEVAVHPDSVVDSDKENTGATSTTAAVETDEQRPAKRTKSNPTELSPVKPAAATRVPTLGVKPKKGARDGKEKRPNTISQARLNALAQPKRRG